MRTKAFFAALLCAVALNGVAQDTPSGVISRNPSGDSGTSRSDRIVATNSAGETYSLGEVASQLRELERVVDKTLPMLDAVTGTTNSASGGQVSTGGALAGILGNILRGNTNETSTGSSGRTNGVFGNILRGVLGTNATATASTQSTLGDLVALRQQLQSLAPVLQRLDGNALSREAIAQPTDHSSTNHLTPTGRASEQSEE